MASERSVSDICGVLALRYIVVPRRVIKHRLCISREICTVPSLFVRYLRGRIKAGTHGLSAVERAYGRLWSMADRTWQIEHRGARSAACYKSPSR